jgi:hypothetical protein
MKTKLLKRIRKKYRIVEEKRYHSTKNGEHNFDTLYYAEFLDYDHGWCQLNVKSTEKSNCLREIHFKMRADLRAMFAKYYKVWP